MPNNDHAGAKKFSFVSYSTRFVLVLFFLAISFIFPASHLAYAHTFSTSESAEFLSLIEQIRAETGLVTMNVENNNNNMTLAQAHAAKASSLLDNSTLDEIREVNNRIANGLETGLAQLEGNVTSVASISQGQIPQDRTQSINETVMSLNDLLEEAITVRVESDQQNNATTWAMVLADLVNVVLSDYGKATGAPFDLTNMSNLVGMEGMEMDHSSNMTMMTSDEHVQMSANSSDATTMTMGANATTSSVSNMAAATVDAAAYQSAQYLTNNSILELYNDTLKPLTLSTNNDAMVDNNSATTITQEEQSSSTPSDNNMTSNINKLEAALLQLRDEINSTATPNEVMMTAHMNIHPLIMQIYGLTME